MKVGTVKKMIILADGFAYNKDLKAFYTDGLTWSKFKYIREWEFYSILLHRAVEGWNRKNEIYNIEIYFDVIYCSKIENKGISYCYYTKTKYLTPQEQAIELCLIELLEGK